MEKVNEMREDLHELKELRKVAIRKCSQDLLDEHIKKYSDAIDEQLVENSDSKDVMGEDTKLSAPSKDVPKIYTITLRTYSWDQSDKFMKLYVSIPGLRTTDADKVKATFTSRGLTLDVKELGGKNYKLVINNLARSIAQERSHWKVKDEVVVLFLCKERHGAQWAAVTAEEVKLKEKSKVEDDKNNTDPSANIMGLMKKMYDEGDDKMKQMLNKTWYESQMKQQGGAGAMPGGLGGLNDMSNFDL